MKQQKKKKTIHVKRISSQSLDISRSLMKLLKIDLIPSVPDMVGVYIILGACILSIMFWILLSLRTQ